MVFELERGLTSVDARAVTYKCGPGSVGTEWNHHRVGSPRAPFQKGDWIRRGGAELGDFLAHGAVSICPPDTSLALEFLPLPDFDPGLAFLEGLLAGPPSSLPVRRRHCDENTFLADRNSAKAMYHGYRLERVLLPDSLADGQHRPQSKLVIRRVLQLLDWLPSKVIPSCTYAVGRY